MMKYKLITFAVLIALFSSLVLPVAADIAQAQTSSLSSIPITGTIANGGGTFTGTFDIDRFVLQNGRIFARGTLTGDLLDSTGTLIGSVDRVVTLPVGISATCDVLHLELGPLDLDLLGLQVHLDQVVLDITADPSGGLLGQLLCSLANALNNGGALRGVVNLLNQILRVLG